MSMRFDFEFFAYSKKKRLIVLFVTRKISTVIFMAGG